MKRTFSDGTRAILLQPEQLLARLAALVPPPRAHTVRYHGVFAPASPLRSAVTGRPPVRKPSQEPPPVEVESPAPAPPPPDRKRRLPWADLLRRVHAVDVLACPCGARARILAFLTAPDVVATILRHLGLPEHPPPITPARAPPQTELFLADDDLS